MSLYPFKKGLVVYPSVALDFLNLSRAEITGIGHYTGAPSGIFIIFVSSDTCIPDLPSRAVLGLGQYFWGL